MISSDHESDERDCLNYLRRRESICEFKIISVFYDKWNRNVNDSENDVQLVAIYFLTKSAFWVTWVRTN